MIIWLLKWYCLLGFVISIPELVFGQHKSWHQYTIEDGVPASEVWNIIQDKKGYMWFSSNRGIFSFNGYEFHTPIDTSASAESESFWPTEDGAGRIWFSKLDKNLWYVENDTIRPWKYNGILDKYKGKYIVIEQINVFNDGSVWLDLSGLGFLIVKKDGSSSFLRGSTNQNLVFTEKDNQIAFATQSVQYQDGVKLGSDELTEIQLWKDSTFITITDVPKFYGSPNNRSAFNLYNDDILISCNDNLIHLKEKRVFAEAKSSIPNIFLEVTKKGEVLAASIDNTNPGLYYFKNLEHLLQGKKENILEGYYVRGITCDADGGIWVATRDGSIFYCPNLEVDIYQEANNKSPSNFMCLANDGENSIFAGLESNRIIQINNQTHDSRFLPDPGTTLITDVYVERNSKRLWCSSFLKYFENNSWYPSDRFIFKNKDYREINAKRITQSPEGNNLWLSSTYGFFGIDLKSGFAQEFGRVDSTVLSDRTFAVVEDLDNNIWVATIQGLRLWKDHHYISPDFQHPALNIEARDIVLLENGTLAFGFKGTGVLIKDRDGGIKHFSDTNGLSSNSINKLVSISNDIYVCTNSGLNRIFKNNNDVWQIDIITDKHGLPSNIVNDVTVLSEDLWVATNKGLAHYKIANKPTIHLTPVAEIFANNYLLSDTSNLTFAHDENNVTIHFLAIDFTSKGKIVYRYRLVESDTTFSLTKNREIQFASLSPGKYTFEIQVQNSANQWGPSTIRTFEILPPWWRTWWFYGLIGLVIAGGSTQYANNRIQTIKRKTALGHKIKDLELAALRAQMNPHFIFNCLGSIQLFIGENDKESANKYLSRFAKLIRLSLHSSIDGKHSLEEEVSMLDNYLALEQMRFKDKFTYSITLEDGLTNQEIFLPPMLVQPFVENSLAHGFKNLNRTGVLTIEFFREADCLKISVTDNGHGSVIKENGNSKSRRSVGMSLTRRRLDLLAEDHQSGSFEFSNITNSDGGIEGSVVNIRIPIV